MTWLRYNGCGRLSPALCVRAESRGRRPSLVLKRRILKALTPTELAYLAGFFDGEGSINIARGWERSGTRYYQLMAAVTQTSLPVLESYRDAFGGGITTVKLQGLNYAQRWQWQLYSRGMRHFLEALYPFIRLKERQFQLAMDFMREYRIIRGPIFPLGYSKHPPIPKAALDLAEEYRLAIQALHGKAAARGAEPNQPLAARIIGGQNPQIEMQL